MSWLIIGTVPHEDFPLVEGCWEVRENVLVFGGHTVGIARGTPALLATACMATDILGVERPAALLVGDTGRGHGSARLYQHLVQTLDGRREKGLTFHYLQPDLDWHNRILIKLEELSHKPMLVADAGYMYVAKMSGFASSYDLFTPDAGEMAFLADETAPHPFYTRGFLLQEENRIPEQIRRAYENGGAARYLLVKGRCDFVASQEGILEKISEPCVENMEPIGGTGDSLTGLVTAFLMAGYAIPQAATLAAKTNRVLGLLAQPTPAFSIAELLPFLEQAFGTLRL